MTYGVSYLPISIFQIITNTMPFWVSIVSFFVLKEKLLPRELVGLVIAFIGVLIIVSAKTENENKNMKAFDKNYFLGILLTFLYASFFSTV